MIRARAVVFCALVALCVIAFADTFSDIMAAHRTAIGRLSLNQSTKLKVSELDSKFEKSMRADFDELVGLERTSPRRSILVSKMKRDTSNYRDSLHSVLGSNWDKYQRAYGSLVPTPKHSTAKASGTSKPKKKTVSPSGHKKGT